MSISGFCLSCNTGPELQGDCTMTIAMTRTYLKMRTGFVSFFSELRMSGNWPALKHAVRTFLTSMLAIYMCFIFQVEHPLTAAVTVLIVAHPMPGLVWSKAFYRFLGTIVGSIMGVLFTSLFAQEPHMFLLAFSIWIGACMTLAILIRNFRAYGAVLAGWTVGLTVFPGIDKTPQLIFHTAVDRSLAVLIAVLTTAIISSLMAPKATENLVKKRTGHTFRKLIRHALTSLTAPDITEADIIKARQSLRNDIADLDSLVEFAAAESFEHSYHLDRRRATLLGFYRTLTALASMIDALKEISAHNKLFETDLNALCHELRRLLAAGHHLTEKELRFRNLNLIALRQRILDNPPEDDFEQLRLRDRLCALIDGFTTTMTAMLPPVPGKVQRNESYIEHHIDWGHAGRSGLRASLAIWILGMVWFTTGWPEGSLMMMFAVPMTVAMSLGLRPDLGIIEFLKGSAIASILAILVLIFIIPQINSFPLLMLTIAPVFLVCSYLAPSPRSNFMAFSSLLYFIALINPSNPQIINIGSSLNQALAVLGATAIPLFIHKVVLPANPKRQAHYLVSDVLSDLMILLRGKEPVSMHAWESRLQDRLVRLGSYLRAAHLSQEGWLRGGFTVLRIGREIIRLRNLEKDLRAMPEAHDAVHGVLHEWRKSLLQPDSSYDLAVQAAAWLHHQMAGQPPKNKRILAQASMSLYEIAVLLGRARTFLSLSGKKIKEV